MIGSSGWVGAALDLHAKILRSSCALLSLGLLAVAGAACRPQVAPPRRAAGDPQGGPLRVERRSLQITLSATEVFHPVGELPPFPPFEDPYPLPQRTLKWERNLVWKTEGAERQQVITHLAARLWRLANAIIDKIRLLEEAARSRGAPRAEAKITALRREASAHLQECVSLLEGVMEAPNPPRMARVRLAHYLRELTPHAAIPHFTALLRDEPSGPRREGLVLDLAQLLLREGAFREAAVLFARGTEQVSTARGRLLRALALAAWTGGLDEADLTGICADCGVAASPLAPVIVAQLPALLAAVARPARAIGRLHSAPPACLRGSPDRLAAELLERLVARGRLGSARTLVGTLRRLGLAVSPAIEERVTQEAGPFPVSALPPGDARLGRLLLSRLRAVALCAAAYAPVEMGIVLRLQGDGRARLLPLTPRLRPKPAMAAHGPPVAPAPSSPMGCLSEAVPRWTLPAWRAKVVLELNVSLSIRAGARRRSPGTDPG